MPIEEISDYPEKMTEFELHWASVNAALGGSPATDFKLQGGYAVAQFSSDKAAIIAVLDDLIAVENQLTFARSDRDDLRTEMRNWVMLFRDNVKIMLPESKYARSLPETPREKADQDELLGAIVDMKDVWQEINTDQPAEVGPALVLRGGYTLAQLQTDLATLRQRLDAVKAAMHNQRDRRDDRDKLLAAAYQRMTQYRARLPLVLEPTDPLLNSMPRLRSADSGGGGEDGGGEPQVPAAPGAPVLTALAGGQVRATWDLVEGAEFYILQKFLVGTDTEFQNVGNVNPAGQPGILTSLPPNETVHVRLIAVNAAGQSPPGPHAAIVIIA
jgi:hypothetical protein